MRLSKFGLINKLINRLISFYQYSMVSDTGSVCARSALICARCGNRYIDPTAINAYGSPMTANLGGMAERHDGLVLQHDAPPNNWPFSSTTRPLNPAIGFDHQHLLFDIAPPAAGEAARMRTEKRGGILIRWRAILPARFSGVHMHAFLPANAATSQSQAIQIARSALGLMRWTAPALRHRCAKITVND